MTPVVAPRTVRMALHAQDRMIFCGRVPMGAWVVVAAATKTVYPHTADASNAPMGRSVHPVILMWRVLKTAKVTTAHVLNAPMESWANFAMILETTA